MTKYKVIKPFVDETGKLWTEPEVLDSSSIAVKMPKTLVEYGFIEEVKQHEHWRAEEGKRYWIVGQLNETFTVVEREYDYDEDHYNCGNYFKSKETAGLVAKAQRLMYQYLHTKPGTPQQNIKNQFEQAHAEARKAVLADDMSQS